MPAVTFPVLHSNRDGCGSLAYDFDHPLAGSHPGRPGRRRDRLVDAQLESDPVKRQVIAASIQQAAFEDGTFLMAGQFSSPAAWRSELSGVIDFGLPIMWNIERRTA